MSATLLKFIKNALAIHEIPSFFVATRYLAANFVRLAAESAKEYFAYFRVNCYHKTFLYEIVKVVIVIHQTEEFWVVLLESKSSTSIFARVMMFELGSSSKSVLMNLHLLAAVS